MKERKQKLFISHSTRIESALDMKEKKLYKIPFS